MLGISFEELSKSIPKSPQEADDIMEKEWYRVNPQTEQEIIDFYINNFVYLCVQLRKYGDKGPDFRNDQWFQYLENHIPSIRDMNILDYGCGSALHSVTLVNNGCKHVTIADLPTRLFKIAQKMLQIPPVKTITITEKYPLMEKYDLIICTDVLEHVKDPHLVLGHLAEHTKYLYLSVTFGGAYAPYHLHENAVKYCADWLNILKAYNLHQIGEQLWEVWCD